MNETKSDVRVSVLDSITKLTDDHRGQVVVAASHGAEYAAYLAAKGGVRAVILNDAGVGKDRAGISGLPYLDAIGIAAATIGYRTARIGDAWYPVGLSPKYPLNTVERYAARAKILRELTAEAGRDPEAVELSFWAVWYREDDPVTVDDGSRHILLGSSEQTAEDISRMAELGVKSMVFNFLRSSLSESLDSIERFAAEVMPRVTG